MAILTGQPTLTAPVDDDLIHVVDVSDTTDNPAGSSKKVALGNLYKATRTAKEFEVRSLQDILDIPGVTQNANNIDVSAVGSFTLIPRGFIDLGANRIICSGDTTGIILIEGLNQGIDIMSSNHATNMFDIEDCTLLLRFVNIFATSASEGAFNIRNSALNKLSNDFQMINTFVDFSNFGQFTDLRTVSSFIPGLSGNAANGPKFFGDFRRIAFEGMQFENLTGIAVDLGSATFDSFLVNGTYIPSATNVFIAGLTSSGNVNLGGAAEIIDMRFEGTFAPTLTNITVDDLRWRFRDSIGLPDTQEDALVSFTGNSTVTTITTIDTPVIVNAIWTCQRESFFSCTTGGRITYIGESDLTTPIDVIANLDTQNDSDVSVYIALNGTIISETGISQFVKAIQPDTLSTMWQLSLSTNDFLEVFVENNSNNKNITVTSAIFRVR